MKRLRKHWKLVALTTLILIVLWLGSAFLVAYQLTRRAKPRAEEPIPKLTWCDRIDSFRLVTSDGQDLGAWFLPGRADRPVVLLLHGNGKCRSDFLDQAAIVAETGCSQLLVTLRAHGDSTGDFNDIGYSARHDVVAAVEWIEKHHAGRPILVFGQSLGAAAAIFAAEELGDRVVGYILDGPYRDLRTAVSNRMSLALPPGLDSIAYVGMVLVAPILVDLDRIAPVVAARAIPPDVPVLILTGSADQKARPEEARDIAEGLGKRAELVIVEGGTHGKLHLADNTTYRDAILAFIDRFVRR